LRAGEHALPDVLADEQAEGVDHEVGEDRAAADCGERERIHGQRRLEARPAARAAQHDRQQQEEDPDRLDHELHEVGERDRPHVAQRRVDDDHGAAQQDRGHLAEIEQRGEDRRVRDGRGDREHQRVGPHHHTGEHARAGPVAQLQHLADGVDTQPLDPTRERQREHQDADADRDDQPHA
jgi:hypothetical protein